MHWIYLHSSVLTVTLVEWSVASQLASQLVSHTNTILREYTLFYLFLLNVGLEVIDIVSGTDLVTINVGQNSITLPSSELINAIGYSPGMRRYTYSFLQTGYIDMNLLRQSIYIIIHILNLQ